MRKVWAKRGFPRGGPRLSERPPAWSADRPTVGAHGDRPAMAELFGSPPGMALGTKAADVAVLVRSAMAQRHDVIRYGRLADNPGGVAIATEGFCL